MVSRVLALDEPAERRLGSVAATLNDSKDNSALQVRITELEEEVAAARTALRRTISEHSRDEPQKSSSVT
jgi:hypothetical protein